MTRRISLNLVIAFCLTAALGATQGAASMADAAMRGDKDALKTLLKQGADVGAAQGDGMTALHWAAERGDTEMAELLVYAGANDGAVTRIGQYTPLHLASKSGSAGVVKALLKGGASSTVKANPSGATALHLASLSGNGEVVNLLADAKADVSALEAEWGQTPLMFAASANRVDAINALVAHHADPNIATKTIDVTKQSQLDRASVERQRKVIEGFVGKDSETRPTPSQMQAAIEASREILRTGKIPPPDKDAPPPRGFNPEEINPPVSTKGGMTALLHAARQGNLEAADALLKGGADINKVNAGDGTSALLTSIINGEFDMAMMLIQRGADTNLAAKNNGVAPLWAVANAPWQPRTRFPQPQEMERQKATYLEVMQALLDKGADVNHRITSHPWYLVYTGCGNRNCGLADTSGSTAFWRAAYGTDLMAMKLLVAYGADPDIPTIAPQQQVRRGGGGPPPAAAAQPAAAAGPAAAGAPPTGAFGQPQGAGGAIMPTAEAGMRKYDAPAIPYGGPGAFAIHAASGVEYGEGFAGNAHRHAPDAWLSVVKYLVEELHADVNLRDNDGYTPLHHAAARGDNEMILYLVSKGADVTCGCAKRPDHRRYGQRTSAATVSDSRDDCAAREAGFEEQSPLRDLLGPQHSYRTRRRRPDRSGRLFCFCARPRGGEALFPAQRSYWSWRSTDMLCATTVAITPLLTASTAMAAILFVGHIFCAARIVAAVIDDLTATKTPGCAHGAAHHRIRFHRATLQRRQRRVGVESLKRRRRDRQRGAGCRGCRFERGCVDDDGFAASPPVSPLRLPRTFPR